MISRLRASSRILYVTDGIAPFAVGGMQSFARRQLETIATSGYALTSVTPDRMEIPASGLGWQNISLPWPARSNLSNVNPWRYVDDLKRFSAAVAAVADNLQPHIIYSEGPLVHNLLKREVRRAPIIFNPHGLEMFQNKGALIEDLKSWPLRGIVADHARRADMTICLSETGQLQNILRDRIGVSEERIAVLPNAAPKISVRPRRAPGQHRFLFVGRDEPRKGISLLLEAIQEVDGATLDLVGVDPNGALPKGVTAHGVVSDRGRMRRFYNDADFLVAPSYAEGMPTVVLEAFAAGLPVIATDVGANADLVTSGETGFLIPRGDRRALIAAIRDALELTPKEHARFSATVQAIARVRFSSTKASERLLNLLDFVLRINEDG